jgi:hypothetical protein
LAERDSDRNAARDEVVASWAIRYATLRVAHGLATLNERPRTNDVDLARVPRALQAQPYRTVDAGVSVAEREAGSCEAICEYSASGPLRTTPSVPSHEPQGIRAGE